MSKFNIFKLEVCPNKQLNSSLAIILISTTVISFFTEKDNLLFVGMTLLMLIVYVLFVYQEYKEFKGLEIPKIKKVKR